MAIYGPGTIDGQGAQFRSSGPGQPPPSGRGGDERPYHLLFTAANSSDCAALFCLPASSIPFASSNANSCGATVCTYNRVSGNNDGFDFISSEFVHASNCGVQSQDDACALFRS